MKRDGGIPATLDKVHNITSAKQIMQRRFYAGRPDRIAERDQSRREMALGLKIRQLRKAAGLTQRALAARIGTHPSAISRIEDADYNSHSMETLAKVADALGMRLIIDFEPERKSGTRAG